VKPLVDLFGEELVDFLNDGSALRSGLALAFSTLLGVDELIGLDEGDLEVTSGALIHFHDDSDVLLELVSENLFQTVGLSRRRKFNGKKWKEIG
jgi:hypothetical protein